ncbi:MAG: phosphomannomutase/phosphoglucomutase [Thiohalocapsa sp.]|uniref:phosphomannomutase/phosphoglucomutase n=1 Tax=Thiohalocapsa sp. TaxID=2497641 RepID=UPI0025F2B4D0|nr:phosphomannomutase/phosphoglucomutase [Thiohalocapsa sp.]MCG6941892.1 phosphomannomutase/phosphoglucomutase [Thiohalocapsa sp.]
MLWNGSKGAYAEEGLAVPDSVDGFGVGTYWWIAYLAAALVLLLALIGAAVIFGANDSRMIEHYLRGYSGTLVQETSNRVAAVRGQLQRWRNDPGLRAALLNGRADVLRDKEAELELLVPGALAVMVFTNEEIAAGGSASQRLSFAGLDMVQRVRDGDRIAPMEAHRVRQPDEHLAIAGPITDGKDGEVLGVVHIELPLSLLPGTRSGAGTQSNFVFRQRVGDDIVPVQPADAKPVPVGAPSVRLPIADTRLDLLAWASPPGLFSGGLLPLLAGLYVLTLALLGVALGMPYRQLRRGVRADLASMVALAEDAVAQRALRSTRGRVRELVVATDALRRRLRELSPVRSVTPKSAAELAALAGDAQDDEAEPDLDVGLDLELPASSQPDGGTASGDRAAAATSAGLATSQERQAKVPADIFRAYDIRGLLGSQLTDEVMRLLGRAVGSEAAAQGQRTCVVARDQRPSGGGFAAALVAGLCESGCDVLDLGIAPTPLAYHAACVRGAASAAIVTASHNPPEYNGLKVVLGGRAANEEQIQGLRERILRGDFERGEGRCTALDYTDDYVAAIRDDITLARPMKLVLDCGFATACKLAPMLYRALDCEITELDCDLDPDQADQRTLDPSQPKNLYALGDAVIGAGADLGLAFDADGDRLGVVDSAGKFIAADRVLMLLAADVLARAPGSDIVYDVKSSHRVGASVLQSGGRPVMWKSGHSFLKQKVRELGAPLGGELTGHIVFGERWNGFDDAFYAGARLLEVLALDPRSTTEVFDDFPVGICTPELFVPLAPGEDAGIMQSVLAMADRLDGVEVNTIDGLRAEFDQGWGLIRSSNTRPGLVFRFEADDQTALDKIQDLYRRMMDLVAPNLNLPF